MVVAVLAGIAFLGEQFSWREGLGAAPVLASVVIILNRPGHPSAAPEDARQQLSEAGSRHG
jgi:drug/metabolite transporter (DMT)-like permease